jgi:uncharacterized protein YdeI (YjbR/CyaY-like superfamily)
MPLNDLITINPKTRVLFREWLKANHTQKESVWVTVYKTHTSPGLLRTNDVVEECLCFGWIDSRPRKNDTESFFLLISPRKQKSVWSAVNKKKISSLIKSGLMTPHGLKKIKDAKANGSWAALRQSDKLILPDELKKAFQENPLAQSQFERFSESSKRTLLEWIYAARTEATRISRIEKTVTMAAKGLKANVVRSS